MSRQEKICRSEAESCEVRTAAPIQVREEGICLSKASGPGKGTAALARNETTREDEERKEERKTQEGRLKEEFTPLGATNLGCGEESLQDPSFLHAG